MKIFNPTLLFTAMIFFTLTMQVTVKAQFNSGGKLLTVNDVGDTNDIEPGDSLCLDTNGKCTLRAAIQESNQRGFNVINFVLPQNSTINLTIGELLITNPVNIVGTGARNLTVQRSSSVGTPQFRIFHINHTEINYSSTMIRGLTIKNGRLQSDGGGVFINYNTYALLTEIAIVNNSAASGGGIFSAGTFHLTRSLIASNISTGLFGGGVVNLNNQSLSMISNSTLTNNSGNQGGAIYNTGSLSIVNNTVSHNSASGAGSSICNDSNGTVNVLNTIVGLDSAASASSLSGSFISLGNNLVTDARNSVGFKNGVNGDQVSNNNAINPLLGNLTDNGGQTDTRILLAGSPAINGGNSCVSTANCGSSLPIQFRLATDQRTSYSRLGSAAVDIGAFESDSFSPSVIFSFGASTSRSRLYGSLIVFTNAVTNEKRYRTASPSGSFLFKNLNIGVYILEIKSKRADLSRVIIYELDVLPLIPLKSADTLIELTY